MEGAPLLLAEGALLPQAAGRSGPARPAEVQDQTPCMSSLPRPKALGRQQLVVGAAEMERWRRLQCAQQATRAR